MANENVSEETWRRKDDLSARQTAANVAGYVFEGKDIDVDAFLKYAEKIRAWLFANQIPINSSAPKPADKAVEKGQEVDLPQPTQQQDKVLKQICKRVNLEYDVVKSKVFEKYGKYPTSEKSIDKIVNELFKD